MVTVLNKVQAFEAAGTFELAGNKIMSVLLFILGVFLYIKSKMPRQGWSKVMGKIIEIEKSTKQFPGKRVCNFECDSFCETQMERAQIKLRKREMTRERYFEKERILKKKVCHTTPPEDRVVHTLIVQHSGKKVGDLYVDLNTK